MTVTTQLPKELAEQLSTVAKADGRSENAIVSEAVAEYLAFRKHFDRDSDVRERLEQLMVEGVNSGEPIVADAEFWEKRRRKVLGQSSD